MANRFINRVRALFDFKMKAPRIEEADMGKAAEANGFRAYAGQGFLPGMPEGEFVDSKYGKIVREIMKLAESKKELIEKVKKVRGYDIFDTIVSKMADDLIYRHNPDGLIDIDSFVKLESADSEPLDETIALLPRQYGFGRAIQDIAPELLCYGEYILRADHDNRILIDDVDQEHTVVIYAGGAPAYIVNTKTKKMTSANNYVVFNLGTTATKVSFTAEDGKTYSTRLGKSIFSDGVLTKITSLKLLESLIPIGEVMNLDKKMYFYLKIPPGTPLQDAYKMTHDYELMLYSILNPETKSTYDDIVHSIGKAKVVPLFGNQDQLNEKILPTMDRIDLEYINDIRTSIAAMVGVPPSYVGVIEGDNANNLASYYQKIAFVRSRLTLGCRFAIETFIRFNQVDFDDIDMHNIMVKIPEILGVSDVDSLDYLAVGADLINNTNEVIKSSMEVMELLTASQDVDVEVYKRLLNDKLMPLVGKPLFKLAEEKEDEAEPVGTLGGLSPNPGYPDDNGESGAGGNKLQEPSSGAVVPSQSGN